MKRSLVTIFRVFVIYRPLALFFYVGSVFWLIGLAAGGRFLYHYFDGSGAGHIQSVILASLCITLGMLLYMMGLIGDLIATNRKISERILLRVRQLELKRDSRRNDSTP